MPEIVSPIDDQVAYRYEEVDVDTALTRVRQAQAAQHDWCRTPIEQRIQLCREMMDAYRQRLSTNAEQITRMMGKPLAQARIEFERSMTERVEALCAMAQSALADDVLPDKPGFRRYVGREPVGVVLDIAAWNYPLLIATNVVIPAVLAGNAVMIKHAHQTALVADQFAEAFAAAGAPAGLVQALPMDHETTARLIATRCFGYVSFTGSVRGGHEIYRAVAQDNFIGVGLELGGKDPALVLPDCDLEFTADNLVDGAFYNAGQSCCGIERIYVHESIYDRFVDAYVAIAKRYVLGDPLNDGVTMGPVVHARAAANIRAQNQDALAKGARALVDATHFDVPRRSPCYVAPSVFDKVDHSMALMRDETFGPSIGIMKVKNTEQAIELMNDSIYGLTASIWTKDAKLGEQVAQAVRAGTVFMNRCDYLDPAMPWTGVKDSGHGVSLSKHGFLQVTRPKNYHLRLEW